MIFFYAFWILKANASYNEANNWNKILIIPLSETDLSFLLSCDILTPTSSNPLNYIKIFLFLSVSSDIKLGPKLILKTNSSPDLTIFNFVIIDNPSCCCETCVRPLIKDYLGCACWN